MVPVARKVAIEMTVLTREDSMDHRSPILGLIVLCLCTATPAAAQDKRALIEKLMEVSNISGQLQSGTQGATAQIMTQIKQNNPTIPDDVAAYVQEKRRSILKHFIDHCESTYLSDWERNFSDDELQSIISFYSSEAG